MQLNAPVLISGAYRSGTTFANAAISCFEGYSSLSSGLKFMRFCFGEYGDELETQGQLKTLIDDCYIRLESRWGIRINVGEIMSQVVEMGISYSTAYDLLIRDILGMRERRFTSQWCDKLVLGWDENQKFLELFPKGVVVHVIRNPVDVLKSYERMTSEPAPVYLDAILNCYSSFAFAEKAAKKQNERLIVCKSEELANPYSEVYERLSKVLETKFDRKKFSAGNFNTMIDEWNKNSTRHKSISINSLRSLQINDSCVSDVESSLLENLCGKYMDEYAFSRNFKSANLSRGEVESILGTEYLIDRYRLAIDGKDPGPSYYTNPVELEWSIVNEEKGGENNLDDAFYLDQVNPAPPKEYFKFIADIAESLPIDVKSWHDIGCGSGEFISYLSDRHLRLSVSGSDLAPELIKMAQKKNPTIQFSVEDFTDVKASSASPNSDVVSLLGVNGRFKYIDDWLPQFSSYISDGGYGLIFDLFNPEPVDVAVSASKATPQDAQYHNTYFNLLSTISLTRKLDSLGFKAQLHRFEMPFQLEKQDDPFRSWTIELASGKRMLTNGLGQIFDLYLCVVNK